MMRESEVPELTSPEPIGLSDAAAIGLASTLLSVEIAERTQGIEAILNAEPCFAEWAQQRRLALVSKGNAAAEQVVSLPELAHWLAGNAWEALGEGVLGFASSEPLGQLLQRATLMQRRLAELEAGFQETLLREKLASLRELAYGASHEINNPLANIATRAQSLIAEETDPEKKRKLAVITSQAYRAHEMISDMMLFAKPPAPVKAPLDLVALVAGVANELKELASRQGTQVVTDLPQMPVMIDADRNQVAMMVRAVGQNALDALRSGGTVEILLRTGTFSAAGEGAGDAGDSANLWRQHLRGKDAQAEDCSAAVLGVRDNGPGVSDGAREHLFDPFYSGREAGRGLGFGLSKSWRVVELHQGEMEVQSELGHGTCVWVRLPLQTA